MPNFNVAEYAYGAYTRYSTILSFLGRFEFFLPWMKECSSEHGFPKYQTDILKFGGTGSNQSQKLVILCQISMLQSMPMVLTPGMAPFCHFLADLNFSCPG